MEQLIEYICALLNIKTDSDLVIVDMAEEISTIQDLADYRKYIRENFNYLGTEYMTGFQKFIKLTAQYKRQYAEKTNAARIEGGMDAAAKLAAKVRSTAVTVEMRPELTPESFKIKGENYFTPFEIKQLNKIGSLHRCVMIQKSVSGDDQLLEKLREKMTSIVISQALAKPKEQINKSTMAIARQAAEGVRA